MVGGELRTWSVFAAAAVLAAACGGEDEPKQCYARNLDSADICTLLGDACNPVSGELPGLSEAITVAPSGDMPEGVVSQVSHNNLDIVWHEGRLFFAFRTAPTHFASAEVVMYVVSTADQKTWQLETSFAMNTDLREPRFLAFGGRLFLYYAVLGYVPATFDPQGTMVTEYRDPCDWSEPEEIFEPGFIPWRTKTYDGTPYLLGYVGGENIYEVDGEPTQVSWLTTDDGRDWRPVVPGQPVVLEGGVSETDFVFRDDGGIVAVARNELGDGVGWGSKICRAEPGDLGNWQCVDDPKKYDSPFMFEHGSDIYLIGRRQVTEDGNYDLGRRDLTPAEQTSMYNREYWITPKRCSLWKVDGDAQVVDLVMDLPSNGDTCFASVVPLQDDQFLIYNYTSPLDDPSLRWVDGQVGPTSIYRTTLQFQ